MVKVAVWKKLLKRQKMSEITDKVSEMIDDKESLSEGLLWHGQSRKTLPKNVKIRKAILAIYWEKNFNDITGYDLYKVVVNSTLRKDMMNQMMKIFNQTTAKDWREFSENKVWCNVLKNYEYGIFSEEDFIKTIFIFLNMLEPSFYMKKRNINQLVAEKATSLISNWDINMLKDIIPLNIALSRIGEETRIKAYRLIIAKLVKLK